MDLERRSLNVKCDMKTQSITRVGIGLRDVRVVVGWDHFAPVTEVFRSINGHIVSPFTTINVHVDIRLSRESRILHASHCSTINYEYQTATEIGVECKTSLQPKSLKAAFFMLKIETYSM